MAVRINLEESRILERPPFNHPIDGIRIRFVRDSLMALGLSNAIIAPTRFTVYIAWLDHILELR